MPSLRHRLHARAVCSLLALAAGAGAQGPTAALPASPLLARLPDACIAVALVPDPVAAVARIGEALGEVPAELPEEQRALIGIGLLALPRILGGTPAELAERLGKGGMALGLVLDGAAPAVVAVAQPGDVDAAIEWVRTKPQLRWKREGGTLLLASTVGALGRFDAAQPTGAWAGRFGGAAPATAVALVELDLVRVRELQGEAATAQPEGFGAALLFPGLVAAGKVANTLRLELHGGEELRIEAALGALEDAGAIAALANGFRARAVPAVDDRFLLYASLDRSLHALFGGAAGDGALAQDAAVSGFLATADLLDGPNSFVDGLLGRLEEPIHLMVFETPPASAGEPMFVLPGLALAARMKDAKVAEVMEQVLGFVNIIGNAERGQRNQQPFLIERLADGEARGLTSVMTDWRGPGLPPLEAAIQPTVLVQDDLLAVATTQDAARRALAALRGPSQQVEGDLLVVRGAPLAASLERDLAPLVLARQLDEGETAEEARRFWTSAIVLLRELDGLRWGYGTRDGALRAWLSLRRKQ